MKRLRSQETGKPGNQIRPLFPVFPSSCDPIFNLALLSLISVASCTAGSAGPARAKLEPGELSPGGATTSRLVLGSNAFNQPASNLSEEHERWFFTGNSFFNQSWVEAVASTGARDGL